ncbi:MAG: hypothetical protein NC251_04265 [Lachnoclostridium sp.]|nr:hypothetical protein [Lachnoclostridium sp.]
MATNPVGWITAAIAAIGAATFGIYKLYDAIDVSLEEQKEKLAEAKENWADVKNELQEVETEIQNTLNAIKELESLPNPTWAEQEELDRLREVTKELELQKQLKQDEQLQAAESLYHENKETFHKEFQSSGGNASISDLKQRLSADPDSTYSISYAQLDLKNNLIDIEALLQYYSEIKETLTDESELKAYEAEISALIQAKADLIQSDGQEMLSSLSEYKKNILDIASVRDLTEDEQAAYDYLSSMQKMIYEFYSPVTWNNLAFDSIFDKKGLEKTKEELMAMAKAGELSPETLKSYPKLSQAIRDSELIIGEGSDAFKEFYNELAALADKQKDAAKSVGSFNDIFAFQDAEGNLTALGKVSESINTIQKAYDTLSSAIDEYNSNGAISVDTLQSVVESGDDWLDYLVAEDGALKLDKESLDELSKSRLEEMRIRTLNNLIDQIALIKNNADANHYLATTNYAAAESFEEVARSSADAAIQLLRAKVASGDLSQANYDAVIDKMYSDISKIDLLFENAATDLSYQASSTATSAAQSMTDLLDKELNVLDKKMEAGYTDFRDYIRDRLALIEDYYSKGRISADEYYSHLEKHYSQELSYRDRAISAVTRRLDKEIDSLEKQKDAVEDSYRIQIDALEQQKTLLEDANRERQRQIDLQKALYELERAKNQRTALVYSESGGMRYESDSQAIRDAEDEAANVRYEIQVSEIEKGITKLEEARDAQTGAIDDMIDKLQDYKEQWSNITSTYEEEQEDLFAAQLLGQEWERDILDMRLDKLNSFKDDYISIQQAMVDAAHQASLAMDSADNVTIGDSSRGSLSHDRDGGYEVIDESTATRVGAIYHTREDADAAAEKLNKAAAALNGMDTDGDGQEWKKAFGNSNIPGYYVSRYHAGLKQGPVGKHSFDEDFKLVQKTGLGEKEVPAILREGEAVATPEQVGSLADALRASRPVERPYCALEREKWEKCLAALGPKADDILPFLSMAPYDLSEMIGMDRYANQVNNINNIKQSRPVVNQNITLSCPNVTNSSGVEYLQKELGHLSQMAIQEPLRRY